MEALSEGQIPLDSEIGIRWLEESGARANFYFLKKFLVFEVAIFKYPVYWVDAELLWQAMATQDSIAQKNRGFVIVNRNAN